MIRHVRTKEPHIATKGGALILGRVRTVLPMTRMRFASVLLKGPSYRSIARSGHNAQL